MSFAPIKIHYPFTPIMKSVTQKNHDIGFARNGIHQTDMKPLPVWLFIANSPTSCRDCGRNINAGELLGRSDMRGNYCRECIVIPKSARHYKVTFTINRRSRKHPDGTVTNEFISSEIELNRYIAELETEGRSVTVEEIKPL